MDNLYFYHDVISNHKKINNHNIHIMHTIPCQLDLIKLWSILQFNYIIRFDILDNHYKLNFKHEIIIFDIL